MSDWERIFGRPIYFDRQARPISYEDFVALRFGEDESNYKTTAYKRVAWTEVGDVVVSTVWLGIDHSFTGGPPLIFETMVNRAGEWAEQWRYQTEAAAAAGHEAVVAWVRAGSPAPAPELDETD